jgi:8-oxo-dGTP diphosphatase
MPAVHVAVAVIINQDNKILISKRSAEQHQGNRWEFPGGKVEELESSQEALCREIKEELDIDIQSAVLLLDIIHEYDDKKVILDVYEVKKWSGEATPLEQQPLLWVTKEDLGNYEFPAANAEILALLQA